MQENPSMSETARLVTAEELERLPDDDFRYELVAGRVIRMSPVGFQHGLVVGRLMFFLSRHLQNRNIGVVLTEVGFKLASSPDTVRAPDISVLRQHRLPASKPRGFWNGPPDLAVEVLSPDDRPGDVRDKVAEYLALGVPLVVVVDPESESVTLHGPATSPVQLAGGESWLDLDEVVPGFRCRVQEIFE